MSILDNLVEDIMKVFKYDFLVFGGTFDLCLHNLACVLARCEETKLVLNRENVIL